MLPYTRPESGQAPQEKPLRGISPWAAIVQRSPKQEATASYALHSTTHSKSCQIAAPGCEHDRRAWTEQASAGTRPTLPLRSQAHPERNRASTRTPALTKTMRTTDRTRAGAGVPDATPKAERPYLDSRTSRTLRAKPDGLNGFWMKLVPGSMAPRCTTASSV